jgi:hypothetical protein
MKKLKIITKINWGGEGGKRGGGSNVLETQNDRMFRKHKMIESALNIGTS